MSDNKKTINGTTFEVQKFPAKRGLQVLTKLGNMVGPALGGLGDRLDEADSTAAGLSALGRALETLEFERLEWLIDAMAEVTIVHGAKGTAKLPDVFDAIFAGAYAKVFQWLMFALEVNFGSFLEETGLTHIVQAAQFK